MKSVWPGRAPEGHNAQIINPRNTVTSGVTRMPAMSSRTAPKKRANRDRGSDSPRPHPGTIAMTMTLNCRGVGLSPPVSRRLTFLS
jgi:hypothetical protein